MAKTTLGFPDDDPIRKMLESQERIMRALKPLPAIESMQRVSQMLDRANRKPWEQINRTLERMNRMPGEQLNASLAAIDKPLVNPATFDVLGRTFERINEIQRINERLAQAMKPLALSDAYFRRLDETTKRLAEVVERIDSASAEPRLTSDDRETVEVALRDAERGELSVNDRVTLLLAVLSILLTLYLSHEADKQIAQARDEIRHLETKVDALAQQQSDNAAADAERDEQIESEIEALSRHVRSLIELDEASRPKQDSKEADEAS